MFRGRRLKTTATEATTRVRIPHGGTTSSTEKEKQTKNKQKQKTKKANQERFGRKK